MALAKFDASGVPLWVRTVGAGSNSAANALDLDHDSGTVVVAGVVQSAFTVLSFDRNGVETWRAASTPGAARDVAFVHGRVIAAGEFANADVTSFAVLALNSDGSEAWRRTFEGSAPVGSNSAVALATDDRTAALYAVGTITDTETGPGMFVAGLSDGGDDLPDPPEASETF
jgi:hypothetical protein